MDCLALIASTLCVLSPSQLTLRADVSTQLGGTVTHWNRGINYHGATLGRVELSMPLLTYRGLTLLGGLEHVSLLDTSRDRGEERFSVGLVWRPFR